MTSLAPSWENPTYIAIGIWKERSTVDEGFALDLAHELGHVMLGPQQTSGVIETICVALSYEVLDRLGEDQELGKRLERLGHHPPFSAMRMTMQKAGLGLVAADLRSAALSNDWTAVRKYLAQHRALLEHSKLLGEEGKKRTQYARAVQEVAAMALRSGPVAWNRFVGLALCTKASSQEDPPSHQDPRIEARCLSKLTEALARIGAD
jgi:hypothetical protein